MGAYKVILALALTALLAGHVFAGAVVRGDEPQSTPILESGRKGNPPDHGSNMSTLVSLCNQNFWDQSLTWIFVFAFPREKHRLKPVLAASSTRRLSTLHRVIFIHHALRLAAARSVDDLVVEICCCVWFQSRISWPYTEYIYPYSCYILRPTHIVISLAYFH